MVENFWKNKKVFLTGHTGFKGSWMSLWLLRAGAQLTGYSLGLPTTPSLFEELNVAKDMNSIFGDVRNLDFLKKNLTEAKPDIVIHMAAQPLVRYSYREPVETYMTNVMGAVHLFESVRAANSVRSLVNVTSDKCYENVERSAGYKEHEPMGGHDPYSNSKGCAELITSAYRKSFFEKENVYVGSGRAGNVIGGGDWAEDRLIPDIIRSVINNETLTIRSPKAVRPWQHVLEPVHGYLLLAEKLYTEGQKFATGYNFGPETSDHASVENILQIMNKHWQGRIKYEIISSNTNPHEAGLLSLDCTKAKQELNWRPCWNLDKALQMTIEWHQNRLDKKLVLDSTLSQISKYQSEL
ncbi:MAG: CDP-glucose 4,6-dehydratase [Bdellovibrionota bacterium]